MIHCRRQLLGQRGYGKEKWITVTSQVGQGGLPPLLCLKQTDD